MLVSITVTSERFKHTVLRELRERSDYTQQAVAGMVGMSISGYRNVETGRANPYMRNVYKLAGLFDVSPTVFFNGNGETE